MRDINFRIWVKPEKKFYFIDLDTIIAFLYETFSKWEKDELDIQQYSGLRDKNNNRIYEGDILGKEEKAMVEFERGSFVVRGYPISEWLGVMERRQMDYNIIGNIYEHVHLLDK